MSSLVVVYSVIILLVMAAVIISRIHGNDFKKLNKKKHKLKIFYPLAAVLCVFFDRLTSKRRNLKTEASLKSLYVKENVDREYYLYRVKKTASAIFIVFCCCLLGFLITVSHEGVIYVQSLERNDYGGSSTEYILDVEYGDIEETVAIDVDAVRHTEEEIFLIFEDSYDAVIEEMLGDNKSQDNVTSPVNLISEYGEISISWEIDDPQILDYNGEITDGLKENETVLVNLYATFSMDETAERYAIPILIRGETAGETEQLVNSITESIEDSNSPYDSEVELPESINGVSVIFKKVSENNDYIFLVFALIAAAVVFFGADKNLDKKLRAREYEMTRDFTEIVSKLSLMYEAGLSIYKAWERIVKEQENKNKALGYTYREMKLTLEKIRGGVSEKQAYSEFGRRCGLHQYIKLGNLLEQNLTKGTKGLKGLLKQEVDEAFETRKRLARKKGEEAGTKLLAPMVIMLILVIVIVAVPALMSMNM